jgi:hypothetical protein
MTDSLQASRTYRLEGREIRVYDDLLSHGATVQLARALEASGFTKSEIARPETGAYKHWAADVSLEQARRLPLWAPTMAATVDCGGGRQFKCYRTYCNFAAYGDMLFTHTDCHPGTNHLTALWFIAREWDMEWGGETLFFNSKQDAEFVVSPRPGRLVIFDGSITHVGRPPNRICFAPRYTFAFKFEPLT